MLVNPNFTFTFHFVAMLLLKMPLHETPKNEASLLSGDAPNFIIR